MTLSEILHNYGSPLYAEIGVGIFVWSGGPYIDVYRRLNDGSVEVTDECINVWDYGTDASRIPFTYSAFIAECFSWINE